ncbi:hypothetical protein [Helicobacter canis]|uniref:hypothetical protein n=1 Tax=Helicobacter canis TaxID=29419 RepID=UPI0011C065FC|nr:hypothetical protein [Helicobacter canis]
MDSRICIFYYGLLKKLRLRLASVDCHADKSARNDRKCLVSKVDSSLESTFDNATNLSEPARILGFWRVKFQMWILNQHTGGRI